MSKIEDSARCLCLAARFSQEKVAVRGRLSEELSQQCDCDRAIDHQ